jgi:CRISPR-associated protein Cas2
VKNILITYDVNTETKEGKRRLRQVATVCKNYGQRVQFSVFECNVDDSQYESFRSKIIKIIDSKVDSIRFYKLSSSRESCIECYGVDKYVNFDEPLIF